MTHKRHLRLRLFLPHRCNLRITLHSQKEKKRRKRTGRIVFFFAHNTRPLSYSSKEFGFHVGGFFLSGASDVGDPKDENWAGVSRRGEGGRKKESFSTPFLAHPPIWKQFAFSCCLAHKRGKRGGGNQKKNLHLRIICRICPGKEDLKPQF